MPIANSPSCHLWKVQLYGYFIEKYYRVAFISLNGGNELIIEFKIAVEADTSVFPEMLLINYVISSQDKLRNVLDEMTFDNAEILINFLIELLSMAKDSKFYISSNNLSLIMKSESIHGTIYQLMETSMIPVNHSLLLRLHYWKLMI